MKTLKQAWLTAVLLMLLGPTLGLAQETGDTFSNIDLSDLSDNGVLELSGTNIPSFTSFTDDQLNALVDVLDATPTVAVPSMANGNTMGGTFWSLQNPGMPPLPSDTINVDVWPMADGSFLLDDLNFDCSASGAGPMGMHAMDDGSPPVPDAGDGSTNYTPDGSSYTLPDYGTNLWIAQTAVASNYLTGIGSNTMSDVIYTVQSVTNLLQASNGWQFEGTIVGSEVTNWTPLSVFQNNRTNLFIRLRSEESSDNSGMPDWWEQLYFGTNAVDPNADPAGDGYDNFYKYENGMNPNTFYTPLAPQGLAASLNLAAQTAAVSWLPSAGAVTGYTLEKTDGNYTSPSVVDISLSATATSYQDNLSGNTPEPYLPYGGNYAVSYRIMANYTNSNASPWSASIPVQPITVSASVTPGPNGTTILAVSGIPTSASDVRLAYIDQNAIFGGDTSQDYNTDIPVSSFTNGLYAIATASFIPTNGDDFYIYAESVDASGNPSGANIFDTTLNGTATELNAGTPFDDGRVQQKQNLIFQLRAAAVDAPFHFSYESSYSYPSNYASVGLNHFVGSSSPYDTYDAFWPFEENYLLRNFVFNSTNVDSDGALTTGVEGGNTAPDYYELEAPTFQFDIGDPVFGALLQTNASQWLLYDQSDSSDDVWGEGIVSSSTDGSGNVTISMANGKYNWFGLPYTSVNVVVANGTGGVVTNIIPAGHSSTSEYYSSNLTSIYVETAQPGFRTVEYDFWTELNNFYPNASLPGSSGFSPTNESQLLITTVANQYFQLVGYAKLVATNSIYTGVYGYLGQYFDTAYTVTNGVATGTNTGVMSPYGNFLATQPGQAALLTMPDPDTGVRGTCMVYTVSLQLDKNHDTIMDTSLGSADVTSQTSPMRFWVNNGHCQSRDLQHFYDYDEQVPPATPNYAPTQFAPYGSITCARDLENFARLWMCGMPALPTNYQVTLSWQNVSNAPAINLYNSVETNGGVGYLTDTNIAAQQLTGYPTGSSAYDVSFSGPAYGIATITPTSSYTFPASYFTTNSGNNYFLFEGAGIGSGELVLTISLNGTPITQTGVWLDLHDIKDLYERAEAVNVPNGLPPSSLVSQKIIDHRTVVASDETPEVVIFVHGINNTPFAYYDSTEVLFKRLYWSGYHGKVAGFRWPCAYLPNDYWNLAEDTRAFNFDKGEFYAWKSAPAFASYLTYLQNRPDLTNYTLNIFAHSQGNIVASEALQEGAPFDNYILTQGAVPAHCYDVNVPYLQKLLTAESNSPTPFYPTNGGYNGYFASLSGNIVNFYNTNDFALVSGTLGLTPTLSKEISWEADQASEKPETYQYLNEQYYSYYPSSGTSLAVYSGGSYYTVTDLEEVKAMVARSRTHAVGAQSGVAGVVNTNLSVDLVGAFNFGSTREEHSAQFDRPIQTSLGYYQSILNIIQPAQ